MASRWIRHPDDVLVSVAWPLAPRRERGWPERGLEARAARAGADDDHGDDRRGCHRGSGDSAESEASRGADGARGSLRIEARPQPGRSFDLVSGAA